MPHSNAEPPIIPTRTPLAKKLNAFLNEKRAQSNDPNMTTSTRKTGVFLPGRTTFIFDLDPMSPLDIPTTMLRSKFDCPDYDEYIQGCTLGPEILGKVEKIMAYLRQGKRERKAKKKARGLFDSFPFHWPVLSLLDSLHPSSCSIFFLLLVGKSSSNGFDFTSLSQCPTQTQPLPLHRLSRLDWHLLSQSQRMSKRFSCHRHTHHNLQ